MQHPFIKINILIGALLLGQLTYSQKKFGIDDPDAHYGGLAYVQTNNGGGVGGFYEYALNSANHLIANLNLIIVRGDNDYPMYDYYSSYYYGTPYYYERYDKTRLNFLSLQLGYKRLLFTDKLANNFRPFLFINAGPVLAIDPPNIGDWSERMKNIEYHWNGAAHFGAGVDFLTGPKSLISLYAGYEYLSFPSKIDIPNEMPPADLRDLFYTGKRDFSGIVIRISFGKKF